MSERRFHLCVHTQTVFTGNTQNERVNSLPDSRRRLLKSRNTFVFLNVFLVLESGKESESSRISSKS